MAKVDFNPLLKWFRGKLGGMIFRRAHNGKVSVYLSPDMTRIKPSKAQKDHRRHFREASLYASAAVADPELRAVYVQMTIDNGGDPRRPFQMASKDYYHNGNDLLWKKHMGDHEKPQDWEMDRYRFYLTRRHPGGVYVSSNENGGAKQPCLARVHFHQEFLNSPKPFLPGLTMHLPRWSLPGETPRH